MLELLIGTAKGATVAGRIHDEQLVAPQLFLVECLQVLRRLVFNGSLSSVIAESVVADLVDLDIELQDHRDLFWRVWELRHTITAYDATYIALSELLEVPLLTTDAKLAGAGGHHSVIELV